MNTTQTKYCVVSLPRTGTMSMCYMMKKLGFSVMHVPGPDWKVFLERLDVLADTPVFASYAVEYLVTLDNVKFIYMEKDPSAWVESMEKVGLNRAYTEMLEQHENNSLTLPHQQEDIKALNDIFKSKPFEKDIAAQCFLDHKKMIMDTIPDDRLLVYSFDSGWKPLCEFVERDVPNPDVIIPHLNKDTMFDSLD